MDLIPIRSHHIGPKTFSDEPRASMLCLWNYAAADHALLCSSFAGASFFGARRPGEPQYPDGFRTRACCGFNRTYGIGVDKPGS